MDIKVDSGVEERQGHTSILGTLVLVTLFAVLVMVLSLTVYVGWLYVSNITLIVQETHISSVSVVQWLGILIVFVAFAQVVLWFLRVLRRIAYQERQHKKSLQAWDASVELAMQRNLAHQNELLSWDGWRKFEVERVEVENIAEDIRSFYLVPHDKKPIPSFQPGQYLTFQLKIPGQDKPVIRCYSLSDGPSFHGPQTRYRVSIKRLGPPPSEPDAPPGLSSNYFHSIPVDTYLDVKAPSGNFFLDMDSTNPIVLIGAGVGLTPVVSMLNAVARSGTRRETYFFYGVRNVNEHTMKAHMEKLAQMHKNIHLHICYNDSPAEGRLGVDYQHNESISVDLFKKVLPGDRKDYSFYMCGPEAMTNFFAEKLGEWGVEKHKIQWEGFTPPTMTPTTTERKPAKVTFRLSKKELRWEDSSALTLLQFAEDHGVDIPYECKQGKCGTCATAVQSGEVEYLVKPGDPVAEGSCLVCSCIPNGDVVLDC